MDYAIAAPRNWFGLSESERATRAKLTDDLCTIDGVEHYVRGCLEVPVLNTSETLVWGVWASISEKSLARILALWNVPVIENEPPCFGWLSTWIRGYPEPKEIKCHVHMRSGNLRPAIVLELTEYPLAVEQNQGITIDRVKQIAAEAGHS